MTDNFVISHPKIESKNNNVIHPPHYNSLGAKCSFCKKPIECIDITRHLMGNLSNAIKYIWRCEFKGKPIEDLKKAIFYLQDEIKEREEKNNEI